MQKQKPTDSNQGRNPLLALHGLRGQRILVVGDILLDRYVWGEVERISPEAPVPVLLQNRVSDVPGGALNVARNVVAAGSKAIMVGVIGSDDEGLMILSLMKELGMERSGVVADSTRPTTLKTRVMASGQQLLRMDREKTGPFGTHIEEQLIRKLERAIPTCSGIIISDYCKGVITERIVKAVTGLASRNAVPVVADPKARSFALYRGVDFLTPNLKEASEAAGRPMIGSAAIEREGKRLIAQFGGRGIIITRGHEGLCLITKKGEMVHVAAQAREVFDVTGAGDTFIAHFTLALSSGLPPAEAARIGNAAAGVAVSKLGAVTVTPEELASAMGGTETLSKVRTAGDLRLLTDHLRSQGRTVVFTNGCFDLFHAGHVRLLREARALGDALIVALNTDDSVRRIKGAPRPILPATERAAVLSALPAVDYIVFFNEDTPERLIRELRPHILVKGTQKGEPIIGATLIESLGGKVVELPIGEAITTGALMKKIKRSR